MEQESAAEQAAVQLFGPRLPLAQRFVELLREQGVLRGLIGPRELGRLWSRHVLNSAVLQEVIPENARVVDVGSGAGLPGIPLALARPDLHVTLLEPMLRRVRWLEDCLDELNSAAQAQEFSPLNVTVHRGRAEEAAIRAELGGCDVVTARAVAPIGKLAQWCLPLARPHGHLVAMKGATAAEELARDEEIVRKSGGARGQVVTCGNRVLPEPTTAVSIEKLAPQVSRNKTSGSQTRQARSAGKRGRSGVSRGSQRKTHGTDPGRNSRS